LCETINSENPSYAESEPARGALYGPGNRIVLHIQKNNAAIMPQQFHAASAVFSPEMNPMPWW